MTASDWISIVAIVVCLLLAFFFAGSETALTASSRAAMLHLAQSGNRKAGLVNKLLETRERLIGAFYQPILVIADTAALDTLSEREFRAGAGQPAGAARIRGAQERRGQGRDRRP